MYSHVQWVCLLQCTLHVIRLQWVCLLPGPETHVMLHQDVTRM